MALVAAPACAQEDVGRFNVPAQPLPAALLALGRQAHVSVLAPQGLIDGRSGLAVRGDMSFHDAFARLLEGSGLAAEFVGARAVRITPAVAMARAPGAARPDFSAGDVVYAEGVLTRVLEPLVVTGSAINGQPQSKRLPVTFLDRRWMDARNALTPIELLTGLPQMGAIPLGESVSGSLGARGDNSAVNLRGIGSNATLILLNGRRLAPHPISATENGAPSFSVNINQLPTRGLQRVDVLRDGASSLYGSDAVAGVINFITTNSFRGTEVRVRVGVPEEGAGKSYNATLTHGGEFAGGRGRYMTTLDAFRRDEIFLYQRSFSETSNHIAVAPAPFNVAGSVFDGRAANLYPTFRVGTATASTFFRPLAGLGSTPGFTSVAPTRAANPEAFIDVNQYQQVQPKSSRINWFTSTEYDLTDRITAFGDFSLYHAKSTLVRNPVPFNAPNADLLQTMSADNPYNPFGSRFFSATGAANADGTPRLVGTPRALTLQSVLLVDGGPDTIHITSNVYRAVGGVRGKIGDTWTWESGLLYSWAKSKDDTGTGFRESLFGQALARTDATAFNPFGYTFKIANGAVVADQPYVNPASVLSTIMQHQRRTGKSSIGSLDFRTSGELFQLWAGAVSLGFGGEVRREDFSDVRPPFFGLNPAGSGLDPNGNDFIQASPKPDSSGRRTVASAYAEVVAPIARPDNNVFLVNSLELSASVRYEHYSDFGGTVNPKFSAEWRPVSWFRVRASRNRGFSAPNLPTVYFPGQYTVIPAPGATDPYRNPVTNEGAYVMRNYVGAAAALKPTTSRGQSAGVVFDLPRRGWGKLTASADYWQIRQRNLIGSLSAVQVLDNDAALLRAYTESQLAAGVPVGQIDLGSGTGVYRGDPNVVRSGVTDADRARFAAYNAANPGAQMAAAGQILSRQILYQNLASGHASGWDYSLDYAFPELPIGDLRLAVDWTVQDRNHTLLPTNEGLVLQQRLGIDGAARSRGSLTLSWRKRGWRGSLAGYYIGHFTDSATATTPAVYEALGRPRSLKPVLDNGALSYRYQVDATVTYKLMLGYDFASGARVRLGVINVTDEKPPLASGNLGYSAAVYSALAVGRTWTLEVARDF